MAKKTLESAINFSCFSLPTWERMISSTSRVIFPSSHELQVSIRRVTIHEDHVRFEIFLMSDDVIEGLQLMLNNDNYDVILKVGHNSLVLDFWQALMLSRYFVSVCDNIEWLRSMLINVLEYNINNITDLVFKLFSIRRSSDTLASYEIMESGEDVRFLLRRQEQKSPPKIRRREPIHGFSLFETYDKIDIITSIRNDCLWQLIFHQELD